MTDTDGTQVDVAIVGGGVIGLSIAWRLSALGCSVLVLERGRLGGGTSAVAAGMLAPVTEVEFGHSARQLLELGLRSAAMWPDFAGELQRASGIDTGLRSTGTLVVARDQDEARELERQITLRESLGLQAERLRPSQAREREPALAPTIRLAFEAPEDHSVDPGLVLPALRRACELAGVELREHTPVAAVDVSGGRLVGVTLQSGAHVLAGRVVIAAGAWSGSLEGLPVHARVPVRPVKGQIIRLCDPAGPGLLERVVRFDGGYLVSRGDGRYVLGATMEERGFESAATAGGVYQLLRDAHELVPGVSELHIEQIGVGLRPSTPDNIPAIGDVGPNGLMWAAGHHRNGVLLAPLTAELIAGVMSGRGRLDPALEVCDPGRFAGVAQGEREGHAVEVPS